MREDILKNKLLKIFFMILVVFLVNSVAYAAEYKIENYDMNVTLKENGDIHVEELLTYDFNAKMNGLYRILLYKYTYDSQSQGIEATSSRYQGDAIQNVYVYTSNTGFSNMSQSYVKDESLLSNGMSGYHSIQSVVSDGNGKKIKVYSPVNSGDHKYVKYEYDITNVGVTYNDASEVYWN